MSVAAARCSAANELPQRRILADELRRAAAYGELLLHQQVLGHQPALLERAAHQQHQMVRIDRLREKVERALLHGGHGVLDAAVGRHDDDRDVGIDFLRRAEHAEPVAFGKAKIGQHQGRLILLHQPNRLRLIARLEHSMARALERMPQHGPQRVFVFDDEDLGGCGHSDEGQRSQPGGTLGSASLFFDVSDFLLQVDDVRLDALELGDRLLPVLADSCPLIRIVAARELGRQAVDAHLQRVEQNFVSMKLLARLADARAPPGLVFRLLDLVGRVVRLVGLVRLLSGRFRLGGFGRRRGMGLSVGRRSRNRRQIFVGQDSGRRLRRFAALFFLASDLGERRILCPRHNERRAEGSRAIRQQRARLTGLTYVT